MRFPLIHLFLAASLILTNPAAAQDVTEVAPGDGLSLGEPVTPQVGTAYIREEFGEWAVRCIRAEEGSRDPCNLYQLLRDANGRAVAEFSVFPLPEGRRAAVGATIVVPLETLLTQQLTIMVDNENARRYPFTFCNRSGCVARVGFTEDEVTQFKRGISAAVRLVPAAAPQEEVVLDISLSGFTEGIESVEPNE